MSAEQRARLAWYYRCLRRAGDSRAQSRRASERYAEYLARVDWHAE